MITLFPSRCYNGGKQHRFEARHDVDLGEPRIESLSAYAIAVLGEQGVRSTLDASRRSRSVYRGDVCVWCGAVVNQPKPKEA